MIIWRSDKLEKQSVDLKVLVDETNQNSEIFIAVKRNNLIIWQNQVATDVSATVEEGDDEPAALALWGGNNLNDDNNDE